MTILSRIGYGFVPENARSAVNIIAAAEGSGIPTAWTVMPALGRDTLTLFAAAAVKTTRIKLGTAIVPAFTRHPLAMATQLMSLEDLAPGRFRLGIGTAHQRTMIPAYGFPFEKPLTQLREYLQVLGPLLKQGEVQFEGDFYRVNAKIAYATGTPLMISTLRENAFELAGEMTEGAITWLCPISYLENVGKPAMATGAAKSGRQTPPLLAHVLVSPNSDRDAVVTAARKMLGYYAEAIFYQRMFEAAGFPLGPNREIPDALIDTLVLSGDAAAIAAGLEERLCRGPEELLLSLVPGDDTAADEKQIFSILSRL